MSCYTSDDGNTWLAIAQVPAAGQTYCGISGIPTTPSVVFANGIPGWRYQVVVGW